MKDANKNVFDTIDQYCQIRDVVLKNAGTPRWIKSERNDKEFLRNGKIHEILSFSTRRKLAAISIHSEEYIVVVGFDFQENYIGLIEVPLRGGHLTLVLSELKVAPTGSVNEIRQWVEYSDQNEDQAYNGHEFDNLTSIYPRILLLQNAEKSNPWNIFFRLALNELRFLGSWVEEGLVEILHLVAELDGERIPYKVLCRSVFDTDPTSFFLAEYRCLEALFAYTSAKTLSNALSLNVPWSSVATALEDTLGWHPREDGSLTQLLELASKADLQKISKLIGKYASENENDARTAARNIYWLRNSIVHYRPSQHTVSFDGYNWNDICAVMANIVLDVYYEAN